jgi:hypothetical protein
MVLSCPIRTALRIAGKSTVHRVQQVRCVNGFDEEVNGARLHGAHAVGNVTVAGQEHHGQWIAGRRQLFLQIEATRTGPSKIQYETTGAVG